MFDLSSRLLNEESVKVGNSFSGGRVVVSNGCKYISVPGLAWFAAAQR